LRATVPTPGLVAGDPIRALPHEIQKTLPVGLEVPQEGHWTCACMVLISLNCGAIIAQRARVLAGTNKMALRSVIDEN
jgi:hypothetical protein